MRILYIDCDSLRPDHLGCYGYHRDTSPNIDRIAADGRRFTNYYAADAPCLPSRTTLFSGRYGIHTGVVNHGGLNADPRSLGGERNTAKRGPFRTFVTSLRQAGYRTAMISPFPERHGAWHVLDGFEEWQDTGGNGNDRADQVYPHAESWLKEHAAAEDWFLHVNFWDPHTHYDTPESYGNPFADDPAPEWPPESTIQEHYESYGPHSAHDVHHGYLHGGSPPDLPRVPDEISSRDDFERWIDGYDVGIRYMDEYIGKLFDLLSQQGVFEDTLVIISADHGENQGELNVYGDHHTADDKTCRLPLVVGGPGVAQGVDHDFHSNVDFAPTITDLAGGDIPPRWDGESFAESITDGESVGRDHVVLSQGAWACQRAVRWDDWLFIRTYHAGFKDLPQRMLFNLADDPHETTDLSEQHPDVVERGESLLLRWHNDRMLDAAHGRNGGNPATPAGVTDPLWEVIREGGPIYTRGNAEVYADRLRRTGREDHAAHILAEHGDTS